MTAQTAPKTITAAFVGNPNTGKTTLFNALSGLRQRVGNYPGVTVEMKKGRMTHKGRAFELIDLPGTYSLAPRSPDEMVAVDLLLGRRPEEPRPDVVVSIVDASNLERNLYLTAQVLDMGEPVVVALNMVDVARSHGMTIDADRLARQLGVPVVPIQANTGAGLDALRDAMIAAADGPPPGLRPEFPPAFEAEASALSAALGGEQPPFIVRRLLLDVGGHTLAAVESQQVEGRRSEGSASPDLRPSTFRLSTWLADARKRLSAAGAGVPAVEAKARYGFIRKAVEGCITRPEVRPVTWTDRLDAVLTHRVWGLAVFLLVMFLVFQSIFAWAKPLMTLIGSGQEWLGAKVSAAMPPGPLASLLTDGVIKGVGGVVVFIPQILILFGFIAVLEDCGYMARAAFLMDRLMSRCGLSGKSFIPLLSSVACAVPGILATRVIENRRDRLATILVAPLMSCSARLPVYVLMIGAFIPGGAFHKGLTLFAMYLLGFLVAPVVALLLKRTLLRGETPVFVMEMPAYKRPSVGTILRRMIEAGWEFTKRAGTLILATMILVWALLYFPRGDVGDGRTYDEAIAEKSERLDALKEKLPKAEEEGKEPEVPEELKPVKAEADGLEEEINRLNAEWKAQSVLGRMGKAIEPAVRPLGWDWKIGMAALASFPAREVVVGTLGIIYGLGEVDTEEIRSSNSVADTPLGKALADAEFEDGPRKGEKVFTPATAVSLMVFFALCAQCASTLAVIRRETGDWRWAAFTFFYMTALAYVGALVAYQVGVIVESWRVAS